MKKKVLISAIILLTGIFFITACDDDKGDTTAPVPGGDNGGKITGGTTPIGGIGSVPCTLSWHEATDNTSATENLEYLHIMAESNESTPTAVDYAALMTTFSDYISGINSTTVETLKNDGPVTIAGVTISSESSWNASSDYDPQNSEEFYAVLVRDEAGNIAAYDIYDPRPKPQGILEILVNEPIYRLYSDEATDDIPGTGGLTYTVTLNGTVDSSLNSVDYSEYYSISGDTGTYLITVTDGNGFSAVYPETEL